MPCFLGGRAFVVGLAMALVWPPTALAQPLAPVSGTAGTCDLVTVQSRIDDFNTLCCTTAECFAGGACSVACANVLLPLVTDCGPLLDSIYDNTDATADGSADVFTTGAIACASPPAPLDPVGGHGQTCALATIDARIATFNAACCTSSACFDGGVCTVDCAIALLPLLQDCGAVLNAVYDTSDGALDGASTILTDGLDLCVAIPSTDALQRVQELHDAGQCPDSVLDSVGEVEVGGNCADTNENCDTFIAMGLLCDGLVGQCDATCLLCTPDPGGGHRRLEQFLELLFVQQHERERKARARQDQLQLRQPAQAARVRRHRRQERRRAQGTNLACDMTTVPAQIARIDTLCCDSTGGVCATGVPTTCDAKCAVFFIDFYDRCEIYINPSYTAATIMALGQLADTCEDALPTEELLLVAAQCEGWVPGAPGPAAAPEPAPEPAPSSPCLNGGICTSIDTTSCTGGSCTSIDTYSCTCVNRYTGETCGTDPLPCCSGCTT